MTPVPGWLSNIINLLAPLAMVIALLFVGVEPSETGETAGLLAALLENLWVAGLMIVQGVKGVIDSVRRWKEETPLAAFKRMLSNG